MDNLLVFLDDNKLKQCIKEELKRNFDMKDLGPVKRCLGMNITQNRIEGKLWISQMDYIEKLLKDYGMQDCKPASTSMDANTKLHATTSPQTPEEKEEMRKVSYQEAVGTSRVSNLET